MTNEVDAPLLPMVGGRVPRIRGETNCFIQCIETSEILYRDGVWRCDSSYGIDVWPTHADALAFIMAHADKPAAQEPPSREVMGDVDHAWWCEKCFCNKSAVQVTFQETCTLCGEHVEWLPIPHAAHADKPEATGEGKPKRVTEGVSEMLAIIEDPDATEDEKDMAASTIAEAVAPDILERAYGKQVREFERANDPEYEAYEAECMKDPLTKLLHECLVSCDVTQAAATASLVRAFYANEKQASPPTPTPPPASAVTLDKPTPREVEIEQRLENTPALEYGLGQAFADLQALLAELATVKGERDEAIEDRADLKSRLDGVYGALADAATVRFDVRNPEAGVRALIAEKDAANATIATLREEVERLKGDIRAVDKEWSNLKAAIKKAGMRAVTIGGELRVLKLAGEPHNDSLKSQIEIAINTCHDVTSVGRFAKSVDPVRWVEQLESHLRALFANAALTKQLAERKGEGK